MMVYLKDLVLADSSKEERSMFLGPVNVFDCCFKTRPGGCKCFEFASKQGLRAYLQKRKASHLVALEEIGQEGMYGWLRSQVKFAKDHIILVCPGGDMGSKSKMMQDAQWHSELLLQASMFEQTSLGQTLPIKVLCRDIGN